ncbi:hypothetical protein GGR55DRAFT_226394 [Xylaria sp. FL0064]|nr:hypothetical protein GGR55DRAFT_226394 [Xylaria sp. FL0064]
MSIHFAWMRRCGGQSVFSKLQASTRPWEYQTRYFRRWQPGPGEPLRKKWPTFEISDLLLDLDAEGAKGVRAYNPQVDGEPMSSAAVEERELQPFRDRVAEFENAYDEYESNFRSIAFDRFHPLHITDFDLLALTLLGPSTLTKTVADASTSHKPASYADTLNSVLDQNGVPHSIRDDTSNAITYMQFRRQSLPENFAPEDVLRFKLDESLGLSQIERVITKAIQAPDAWRKPIGMSDELDRSLSAVPETESVQLLSLLNNIVSNLEQRRLGVTNKLYELGIWTSLRCNAILTAQQYVEKRHKNGGYSYNLTDSILTEVLHNSIASRTLGYRQFELGASSRLEGVFSLLTGYVPGEEQLIPPLRSLVNPKRSHSFRLYIRCLARLGAFRTIWHEWHQSDSASDGTNVNTQQSPKSRETDHFVTAILDALAKNHSMTDLAEIPEFTTATGQFREDCQLDMLCISRSAEVIALPDKEAINSEPTPAYVENSEKLYQIFSEKSIEKTLPALQAFLRSKPSLS